MKIPYYIIVTALLGVATTDILEKKVNDKISEGYMPIGNVFVIRKIPGYILGQAMILGQASSNVFNINVEQKEDHNENES